MCREISEFLFWCQWSETKFCASRPAHLNRKFCKKKEILFMNNESNDSLKSTKI